MKFVKENLDEVSPPGFEKTVKAMKKHKEIDNPYALAWYMKNKGYKSRKESTNIEEACWDTHMQKGMKMKNGRMVPNCVPKEEVENVKESFEFEFADKETAQKFMREISQKRLGSSTGTSDGKVRTEGPAQAGVGSPTRAHQQMAKIMKKHGGKLLRTDEGPRMKRVFKEDVDIDELSAKTLKRYKDRSQRDRQDTVQKGYDPMVGRLKPDFEARRKKRVAGLARAKSKLVAAEGFENPEYDEELSRMNIGEAKVGDTVHLGHGTKGGSGVTGKVVKVDGNHVHIKNERGDMFKGPKNRVTVKESEINEFWQKQVNPRSKGWKKATVKMNFKSFNSAGEGPNHFRKGDKLFYHPMKLDNYNVVIAATDPKDSGSYFSVHPDRLGLKGFVSATGALRDHVELEERHLVMHGDGNYVSTTDGEKVLTVSPDKKQAKRFSKSMATRIANQPITKLVGGKHVPTKRASGKVVRAEEVELDEMSAKQHYRSVMRGGKGKGFVVTTPIDRNRYPNREREGLEGPYKSRKSGKIFYYDKKEGKYYDPDSDMFLQVSDVMEEAPKKVKIKLDPKKKIGYEVKSVGPGGKTTVTKRRDIPGKEDIGEQQTPLQRRAEIERGEAKKAEQAARNDMKRRRARKARQEYARERNRRLDLGEATSKEIKDLISQYNKIRGKSAKMSGRDVILNGKKTKADAALETMAAAVMKVESFVPVVSYLDYQSLDEKKITKIGDIGPKSPHWKKCKLAAGIRYGGKSYKKGDTVFCHPFDNDRVVIRPTMKDGNAFLRRSSIENPPAPLKEAVNQRGRMVRPAGQVSKHRSGSMGTRPETESPSGAMAREYGRQKMYDKRKPGGGDAAERYKRAKDSVKRLSTQNRTGQSVKTLRRTQGSMDAVAAASKAYKGGNF